MILKNEQRFNENEKIRNDLQKDLSRTKAELSEISQEMAYLQDLYKKEVKKSNESEEKIGVLQQDLKKKERNLAEIHESFEDLLKEMDQTRKLVEILNEEKRILNREKNELFNEKKGLLNELSQNSEIDQKIKNILEEKEIMLRKLKY